MLFEIVELPALLYRPPPEPASLLLPKSVLLAIISVLEALAKLQIAAPFMRLRLAVN
jgi:hypothetical protein